jgi:hypothetical protein
MTFSPLPFRASLQQYRDQAADLLRAWQDGNATAIDPLGWAVYAGQPGIAEYLRAHGAV